MQKRQRDGRTYQCRFPEVQGLWNGDADHETCRRDDKHHQQDHVRVVSEDPGKPENISNITVSSLLIYTKLYTQKRPRFCKFSVRNAT